MWASRPTSADAAEARSTEAAEAAARAEAIEIRAYEAAAADAAREALELRVAASSGAASSGAIGVEALPSAEAAAGNDGAENRQDDRGLLVTVA